MNGSSKCRRALSKRVVPKLSGVTAKKIHPTLDSSDWKCSSIWFRYPIRHSWLGGDEEPGNAYAVLYSLQRTAGRKCDFKTYTDSEVQGCLFIVTLLKWDFGFSDSLSNSFLVYHLLTGPIWFQWHSVCHHIDVRTWVALITKRMGNRASNFSGTGWPNTSTCSIGKLFIWLKLKNLFS